MTPVAPLAGEVVATSGGKSVGQVLGGVAVVRGPGGAAMKSAVLSSVS